MNAKNTTAAILALAAWTMTAYAAETSAVGGLSCAKGGVSKAEYLDLVEAAVSAYPEDHVAEYIDEIAGRDPFDGCDLDCKTA